MNHHLSREAESLLERIVTGELDVDSPEVRERAASSPDLARAIREWEELQAGLERARGTTERQLAEAREGTTSEDEVQVGGIVERLRQRGIRRRVKTFRLVAAAAVLAVALLGLRLLSGGAEEEPITGLLGDDRCLHPTERVEAYGPFSVDVRLEPRWTFQIVVHDSEGQEVVRSGSLSKPEWHPTGVELERLESESLINWTFTVRDASGEEHLSGGCRAWR